MTEARDPALERAPPRTDGRGASRLARRAAGADDASFLAALFRDDRRAIFAAAVLPEAMLDLLLAQQYRAHEMGCARDFPQARREVIVLDGVPAGRLTTAEETQASGRCLRVVDVVLRPERRGEGLGSALFAALIAEAASAGFNRITLSALRHDAAVQRFYRRLGFVETGGDEVYAALARDLGGAEGRGRSVAGRGDADRSRESGGSSQLTSDDAAAFGATGEEPERRSVGSVRGE